MLAFAFGLRLRSKTQRSKTQSFGGRLPNGKPQVRLRFRELRGKTLAFQNRHCNYFLRFKGFPRGQGLRSGPLRSKNAAFCICVLKPTKWMRSRDERSSAVWLRDQSPLRFHSLRWDNLCLQRLHLTGQCVLLVIHVRDASGQVRKYTSN